MTKFKRIVLFLIPVITFTGFQANENQDYIEYHRQIIEAEKLLGEEQFAGALARYEQIFSGYDFVFLRDYKVASQLALYLDDKVKSFEYLQEGIAAGWELKAIRKNKFLKALQQDPEWISLEQSYSALRSKYEERIDTELKEKVRHMYKKDQKKAMGALFRIGNKAQERYGTEKFAPHSEDQMFKLIEILDNVGYPGEKIIGNDFWMSTVISHHNSISLEYCNKDTLYSFIRPGLIGAIERGEMSPYEFALIDDWQRAVVSERSASGYGFLITPKKSTLIETDQLRNSIGLRSIELRNKLVDIEVKTGMNFYLPEWIKGKITIE